MKRLNVVDVMLAIGVVHSKSEARRAISQRAVTVNGVEVRNFDDALEGEVIIRLGKTEKTVRVDEITSSNPGAA